METSPKKLYRIEEDKVIGGVCAGLGAYFHVDPIFFRILFVLLAFANGIGIIGYIVLWILVPISSEGKSPHNKIQDIGTS